MEFAEKWTREIEKGKLGLRRFYLFPEKRKERKKGGFFQKREHSQQISQVLLRFSQQNHDGDRVYCDFNNSDGYNIAVEN